MNTDKSLETRAFISCTVSNVLCHFCFTLLPSIYELQYVKNVTSIYASLASVLLWLLGARLKNAAILIFLTPAAWVIGAVSYQQWRSFLPIQTQDVLIISTPKAEILGELIPSHLLFIWLASLTVYLITTLHWLHLSEEDHVPLKQISGYKIDPSKVTRYPLSAMCLLYWGIVLPLAMGLWSHLSPAPESLSSPDLINLSVSFSFLLALCSLLTGSAYILLSATPPALLYLEKRQHINLRTRWRFWAWSILFIGVCLMTAAWL